MKFFPTFLAFLLSIAAAQAQPFNIISPAISNGTATSTILSAPHVGVLPGCVGDGVADDTTCVQAALNLGNKVLIGHGLYKITASLTVTVPGTDIEGEGGTMGIYTPSFNCTSGFVAGVPNLSLLYITADNVKVRKTCFQMGTTLSANTSGAAVTFIGPPPGGINSITKMLAEDNQVNYPFIAFDLSSSYDPTTNVISQLFGGDIQRNVVTQLAAGGAGFRIGAAGIKASEGDLHFANNNVVCQTTNSGVGFLWIDGGGNYATDNDVYNCGTGTKIFPGPGQSVANGWWRGVLGDTSSVNDLLIDSNGGSVIALSFMQTWTSGVNGHSSVIQNSASGSGGIVEDIDFIGHRSYLQNNSSLIGLDIEGGDNVSVRAGRIMALESSPTDTAYKIGAAATNVSITDSAPSNYGGTIGTGIQLATGAQHFHLGGNDLQQVTTPISYTPSSGATTDVGIITDNLGVDDSSQTLAAASTITLAPYPITYLTGSAAISTIYGKWQNRVIKLTSIGAGGFTLTTGGVSANSVCAAATVPQFGSITLTFLNGLGCWAAG